MGWVVIVVFTLVGLICFFVGIASICKWKINIAGDDELLRTIRGEKSIASSIFYLVVGIVLLAIVSLIIISIVLGW
jgi:hypothetical protein